LGFSEDPTGLLNSNPVQTTSYIGHSSERVALLPRLMMYLQAGQLSGVDFEHFSECGMIAPSFF